MSQERAGSAVGTLYSVIQTQAVVHRDRNEAMTSCPFGLLWRLVHFGLFSTKMTSTLAQRMRRRTETLGDPFLERSIDTGSSVLSSSTRHQTTTKPRRGKRRRCFPWDSTRALLSYFLGYLEPLFELLLSGRFPCSPTRAGQIQMANQERLTCFPSSCADLLVRSTYDRVLQSRSFDPRASCKPR